MPRRVYRTAEEEAEFRAYQRAKRSTQQAARRARQDEAVEQQVLSTLPFPDRPPPLPQLTPQPVPPPPRAAPDPAPLLPEAPPIVLSQPESPPPAACRERPPPRAVPLRTHVRAAPDTAPCAPAQPELPASHAVPIPTAEPATAQSPPTGGLYKHDPRVDTVERSPHRRSPRRPRQPSDASESPDTVAASPSKKRVRRQTPVAGHPLPLPPSPSRATRGAGNNVNRQPAVHFRSLSEGGRRESEPLDSTNPTDPSGPAGDTLPRTSPTPLAARGNGRKRSSPPTPVDGWLSDGSNIDVFSPAKDVLPQSSPPPQPVASSSRTIHPVVLVDDRSVDPRQYQRVEVAEERGDGESEEDERGATRESAHAEEDARRQEEVKDELEEEGEPGLFVPSYHLTDGSESQSSDDSEPVPYYRQRARRGRRTWEHSDRDSDEESEDESLEAASAYTINALQRSVLHNGCNCDGISRRPRRTPETATAGLSLRELIQRYEAHIPNVMSIVRETRKLPQLTPQALCSAPWDAFLAGVRSRLVGDAVPDEDDDDDEDQRIRVSLARSCLSRSTAANIRIERWFDLDAWFIPLTSLAACSGGFQLAYTPSWYKTIGQDWHFRFGRGRIRPLRCKHFYLGYGVNSRDFATYVFFPNLPHPCRNGSRKQRRVPMTHDEQRAFVDSALLPALRLAYGSIATQYHPRSWQDAYNRATRARHAPSGKRRNFALLHYALEAGNLAPFWEEVQRRLGLMDPRWQGAQLGVVTYNCKTSYRQRSFPALQAQITRSLHQHFDCAFVDERSIWVDRAFEDHATVRIDGEVVPTVLIRRAACNQHLLPILGVEKTGQSFQWHGTADASSIRATTGAKSAARLGGVASFQAYNVEKNCFASVERSTGPLFGDLALRTLGFNPTTLAKFEACNISAARRRRRGILSAAKYCMRYVHDTVAANEADDVTSYAVRYEVRELQSLTLQLELPEGDPTLDVGHHWPFYVFRKTDVFAYVRWEVNRWLYAICAVLSPQIPSPLGAQETEEYQHRRTAMLTALLDCVEETVNSGALVVSRMARDRYYKRGADMRAPYDPTQPGLPDGIVRLAEDSSDDDEDIPAGGPHERQMRRGLALLDSLEKTGVFWLPRDMFLWHELRFSTNILTKTAFVDGAFEQRYRHRAAFTLEEAFYRFVADTVAGYLPDNMDPSTVAVNSRRGRGLYAEVIRPLWRACILRYCNWFLGLLAHHRKGFLPTLHSGAITDAERQGCYGLSYGLIKRASNGARPFISRPRGYGGNAQPGGFNDFPNTLATKIRLLFDWDDGFSRGAWDNAPFRRWMRICHQQVQSRFGPLWGDRFKGEIGNFAQRYISILPRYEKGRSYTYFPPRGGSGAELKWMVARRGAPGTRALNPTDPTWYLLVEDKTYLDVQAHVLDQEATAQPQHYNGTPIEGI